MFDWINNFLIAYDPVYFFKQWGIAYNDSNGANDLDEDKNQESLNYGSFSLVNLIIISLLIYIGFKKK